jgi:putative Holliday junction resolvase
MAADDDGTILALDVGAVRIGLALASNAARLASPYTTLQNTGDALAKLSDICTKEHVVELVIGLPRGMSGQDTAQTAAVQVFGEQVEGATGLPVHWQDETLTSVKAEDELRQRSKPYRKEDIDALAATYILEDYLHANV